MRLKKEIFKAALLSMAVFITSNAQAKIWRVNNTAGINADFKTLNASFTSNSVLDGDTVYVEGSDQTYDLGY